MWMYFPHRVWWVMWGKGGLPVLMAMRCPNQSPFVFLSAFFLSLDEFDAYIIVSFVNATLVLSIGETVEEVTDSGFLGTTPTLSCSLLGEDALVQVSGMYLLDHPYSYLCSY